MENLLLDFSFSHLEISTDFETSESLSQFETEFFKFIDSMDYKLPLLLKSSYREKEMIELLILNHFHSILYKYYFH